MTAPEQLALMDHLARPAPGDVDLRPWAYRAYEVARQVSGEAFVRVVIGIARASLGGQSATAHVESAIACAEAWVACPCDAHSDAAWRARDEAFAAGRVEDGGCEPMHKAAGCAAIAAYLVQRQASPVLEADAVWFSLFAATRIRSFEEVRAAVLNSIRAWLAETPGQPPEI